MIPMELWRYLSGLKDGLGIHPGGGRWNRVSIYSCYSFLVVMRYDDQIPQSCSLTRANIAHSQHRYPFGSVGFVRYIVTSWSWVSYRIVHALA